LLAEGAAGYRLGDSGGGGGWRASTSAGDVDPLAGVPLYCSCRLADGDIVRVQYLLDTYWSVGRLDRHPGRVPRLRRRRVVETTPLHQQAAFSTRNLATARRRC
jgi:hypothetical protein